MKIPRRTFLGTSLLAAAGRLAPPLLAQETQSRHVPWLAEVQTPPDKLPDNAPKFAPLLVDAAGQPIRTLDAWKRRRAELRKPWLDFLQPLNVERKPPRLEVLEEDRPDGVIRQLVRYESEPGIPVEGYLLRPAKARGKRPGVVVMHSTVKHTIRQPAGVEGKPEKAFGLQFAKRGYVAFCPRCFLWQGEGDYKQLVAKFHARHPQSKGMAKMLFDAQRAVDVLAAQDDVDPKRLAAVGHSLGAKEALYLAALDERVQVAVSSEGGIGIDFSNWDAIWYLSDAVKRDDFHLSHHELLALVAPRAFLLLGGDSADGARSWPYITSVLSVYQLYGGRPRVGLFNHHQGHAVPPEAEKRIYEWVETYV